MALKRLLTDERPVAERRAVEARLAQAQAAHVVSRLRWYLMPATTDEVTIARCARAARTVHGDAFNRLPPTRQLEVLLAVFDDVSPRTGDRMRKQAADVARAWRASEGRRVAEQDATTRF